MRIGEVCIQKKFFFENNGHSKFKYLHKDRRQTAPLFHTHHSLAHYHSLKINSIELLGATFFHSMSILPSSHPLGLFLYFIIRKTWLNYWLLHSTLRWKEREREWVSEWVSERASEERNLSHHPSPKKSIFYQSSVTFFTRNCSYVHVNMRRLRKREKKHRRACIPCMEWMDGWWRDEIEFNIIMY
jgi:hypothetical protein